MTRESFNDEGRLIKMEVDYSSSVDEKIPIAQKLAKDGKLSEALEILLSLEKQTRTGADTHSTSRILVEIVRLCFEGKSFKILNDTIVTLTKRRSQIKQSITKMIQECCTFVDQIDDKKTRLELIDTLRTVTAGKIYVEVERARLTHKLAVMKEAEGKMDEAATIMIELQVETFGSMDKREKVELILEQIRYALIKKDFVKTQIISKKIHTKFFEGEEVQDLKLTYYNLMIQVNQHDEAYLNICKNYRAVFSTPTIKGDEAKKHEAIKNIVLYIILSPYDNEQADLIQRIFKEKELEELPKYKDLLKLFIDAELINWRGLISGSESLLRNGTPDCPPTGVFGYDEIGNKRWTHLKDRVVEHNIRMMAKYYSRIKLSRMAELLDLTVEKAEDVLSNLVVKKTVWAKVDRLEQIINFSALKDPNEVLNEWSININTLMQLVCKMNHLINKEEMIHQHLHVPRTETATSSS